MNQGLKLHVYYLWYDSPDTVLICWQAGHILSGRAQQGFTQVLWYHCYEQLKEDNIGRCFKFWKACGYINNKTFLSSA